MPIVVASKARYEGTITPPSLNTEVVVVEVGPENDDYIMEGYIDLSALASGDVVVLAEYIAVDGVNYRPFLNPTLQGPLSESVIRFHSKTILYNMKYKVTIKQTAGTIRSFPYGFTKELLGTA
jgi:hypothetical protein